MSIGPSIQHVLIVDDDPILCEVLKAFFEQRGASQTSVASNGIEAKRILDAAPDAIDLISCDLNMPDADGIEFVVHLKSIQSRIPIIIVSSAHDSIVRSADVLAKGYNLNLISTLKKPVNMIELEAVLSAHLSGRQA